MEEKQLMKHHVGLTIDTKLLREIEELRGREKEAHS